MAAPVDSNRATTSISTAATSFAINMGSPAAGDLLIVFVRFAGSMGTVTFSGFTEFVRDATDASDDEQRLYYKVATGSEGATQTMTCTSSQKLAAICWRITGAADPATMMPSGTPTVIGTAANINPGAVTPGALEFHTATVTTPSSVNGDSGGQPTQRIAQSFKALTTSLSAVGLKIAKVGAPTDNLVIEIRADSGGVPGSSLLTVATIAGTSLTTTPTYTEWSASLGLTVGSTYWVVARKSGARSLTDYYTVDAQSWVYPGGNQLALGAGDVWSDAGIPSDLVFRVVVPSIAAADYLFLTLIGMDSETATATQPSGYSNLAAANSGTGGAVATNCMIWGASKAATGVTSDDPAAWTSSAPNAGVMAFTIAIPAPAVAAAPGPTPAVIKQRNRRVSRFLTFR